MKLDTDPSVDAPAGLGEVRAFLDLLASFTPPRPGWRYGSHAALVLDTGRAWGGSPLPTGVTAGRLRHCFENASRLAEEPNMVYVEGWALPANVSLPVEHAWCVNLETGRVVDPTWRTPGALYAGTALSVLDLRDGLLRTGCYGLFGSDHACDFHLLRHGVEPVAAGGFPLGSAD